MTTKTKTTVQINTSVQNTTPTQIQAQNSPVQNTTTQTPTRRVISIATSSRNGAKGRPSSRPSQEYVTMKLRELLLENAVIDLGDYETVKVFQIYISSYSANYAQGLILTLARHKESDYGLLANLAFRASLQSGEVKINVKNAIRIYQPLLENLINLTRDLDVTYVFK